MSTIKSSAEHLTLNADGASKDIKFQANGVEKASISSAGAFTSTTIDATALTGDLPAISGANLTGVGVAGISSSADATAITIDSSENVGIGVTPEAWHANWTALQLGATGFVGQYQSGATDVTGLGSNIYSDGTYRYIETDEAAMIRLQDGEILLSVAPSGSADAAITWTNAMTIDNDGNIVQGTASTGSDGRKLRFQSSTYTFRSGTADAYHYEFYNANGAVGRIRTSGSATAYNTSSDYRLKENVDYTWDATTRLKQLKPARFNFIADDTNTLVDGFIAHEVSSVVPEAISGEKDAMMDEEYEVTPAVEEVRDEEGNITTEAVEAVMGTRSVIDPQGIDQSKLVPLLVKTIQELEARITALEA